MEGTVYSAIILVISLSVFAVIALLLTCSVHFVKKYARYRANEDHVPVLPPQELVVEALKHKCTEQSDFYVMSF
ncbi:unnamed protein product [Auanema sp. JU1783]|nr:unnamed protein product [Auanema sp. JU1783]